MYFTAPEPSDLISFSELEIGSTDLAMWKKHLLKACERNPCFKQTLISALIVVVNSSECKSDWGSEYRAASCFSLSLTHIHTHTEQEQEREREREREKEKSRDEKQK